MANAVTGLRICKQSGLYVISCSCKNCIASKINSLKIKDKKYEKAISPYLDEIRRLPTKPIIRNGAQHA